MRAALKHLSLEPSPETLSADPRDFSFQAQMLVGPADGPGDESFDVTVCSPEWLAARCQEVGIVDARHHLVVAMADFDKRVLRSWLQSRVESVEGPGWAEIAERIARLAAWEFEDYTA